ncbi:MAG: hypothetical protein HY881_13890 [Deltaproteobacteria bacterium]|nr:hypothetical protein [Deltaproteobacteria bacterium]
MLRIVIFILWFITVVHVSKASAANCDGCCSYHEGVCCSNGITACCDGTVLSQTCIQNGCDMCTGSLIINNADLITNHIDVTLSNAGGKSGPLDIQLRGTTNTYTEHFNGGSAVGEGTYSVVLTRPSIPEDKYDRIVAIWKLSTGDADSPSYSLSPAWRVLGIVRHTQYNTPVESACTGTPQTAWVFDDDCNFTQTTLDSEFYYQVKMNGTGDSNNYGIIKSAVTNKKKCSDGYPQGASTTNSFFMVDIVTGCCNTQLTESSQAGYPNPKLTSTVTPKCGDRTLLIESDNSNRAEKSIADYCPDCRDGHHIDNYTYNQACSAHQVGSLGDFWTANVGL